MRMWNVPPPLMCRQHLLGEHVELHMFVGTLRRNGRIGDGYLDGLVEVHNIALRHSEIVEEMQERGWNHASPMKRSAVDLLYTAGHVDGDDALEELVTRCTRCLALTVAILGTDPRRL